MTASFADIDRTDFIGRYLAEIGLGFGTVALRLAASGKPGTISTLSIVISGRFSVTLNGGAHSGIAPAPDLAVVLATLLNEDVTNITVDKVTGIKVFFGASRVLEIHPDPDGFECASINIHGKDTFIL